MNILEGLLYTFVYLCKIYCSLSSWLSLVILVIHCWFQVTTDCILFILNRLPFHRIWKLLFIGRTHRHYHIIILFLGKNICYMHPQKLLSWWIEFIVGSEESFDIIWKNLKDVSLNKYFFVTIFLKKIHWSFSVILMAIIILFLNI